MKPVELNTEEGEGSSVKSGAICTCCLMLGIHLASTPLGQLLHIRAISIQNKGA